MQNWDSLGVICTTLLSVFENALRYLLLCLLSYFYLGERSKPDVLFKNVSDDPNEQVTVLDNSCVTLTQP